MTDTDIMFDGLDTKVEIVPAGQRLSEGRGKATHTAHFDVVCPTCGPIASGVMYPTATQERADHLCVPKRKSRQASDG